MKARIRVTAVLIPFAVLILLLVIALIWMTSTPGKSHSGPVGIPAQSLINELERSVTTLARTIGERNAFHPDKLVSAQLWLTDQFRSASLTPAFETFTASSVNCTNVIATLTGTTRPSEIVVIGAHYDSVTGSPGANDNATGVAAMLALARRFATTKPARTLRFVAFVNEEPPFFETDQMGSRVHARASKERGDDIVAMLSLETLGCYTEADDSQRYPSPLLKLVYPARGNFVTFVSDLGSRSLMRRTIRTFREHARIPSEGGAFPAAVPGVGWSDHRSFWLEGWPAVMVTDTALFRDPHYHLRTDDVAHVDFTRLALVVEGLEAVVADLANPKPGT
jgi:Zn-dependent M28 family amino/carboxypeptidase